MAVAGATEAVMGVAMAAGREEAKAVAMAVASGEALEAAKREGVASHSKSKGPGNTCQYRYWDCNRN